METLLQKILNILIAPPGNLIFHLVLAFSVLSCLQSIIISRRFSSYPHSGRLIFGLTMLLAGQLVLFLSSGLAWQGLLNPHVFLPPLDRAILTFSLVWIVWLWCFNKPARLGDLVTGFLNLVILILFMFTYASWSSQGADLSFNNYWTDWVWELAGLFVVLTGMGILLFSRPAGWGVGVGMLGLSLAGIVAHALLTPNQGDFSGLLRFSQLAAFPLLPNLLQHLAGPATGIAEAPVAAARNETSVPKTQIPGAPFPERRRYSSDMRTVHAFLQLKESDDREKTGYALSKAIAHTMLADLCFFASNQDYGQVVLHNGYDLIREDEITGTALEQSQVPLIAGALQRGKALRVTASDSQPTDLRVIGTALGLQDPGTLLLIPLILNDKPSGGLLLLSPYSNRQWTIDDQNYLSSETGRIAAILRKAQNPEQPFQTGGGLPAEQALALQAEIDRLKRSNQDLANSLDETLHKLTVTQREHEEIQQKSQPLVSSPDMDALIALQKEAQDVISSLQSENERLHAALASSTTTQPGVTIEEAQRMESDLRSTLKQVAHLQNQLAKSNAQILMYERQVKAAEAPTLDASEAHEVLVSIVQDLRQPMASIIGYTELLLSESVGILGTLQRKFLERTLASTERMHAMMDDLIQVITTGKGPIAVAPQPVELGSIIDEAVIETSAQLREKNIILRVDLPREFPKFDADREALQQIMVHLLQNAGVVTPQEGTITLRARQQVKEGDNYLLLQVVDTGGGIQTENLSRVFSPRYRADSPLIQGLGDTGVGLSIAKALVEANGGRIWVESETGQTTTFSVLLPLRDNVDQEKATVE